MEKKEAKVIDWAGLTQEMERLLRLKTSPVAYKRLEKMEELEKIPGVMRLNRRASFFSTYFLLFPVVIFQENHR